MSRIGDRRFMHAWQTIRAATQPGPEASHWEVAGVQWQRHRYSHSTPDHTMVVEVHRLDHGAGHEHWSIMVVIEHWWDDRRKLLRDQTWVALLSGSRADVTEWIASQAKAVGALP